MKKLKFLSLAFMATMCALFMVSCDDDDATIEENDIPDGTHVVNYSVQVIPSSLNGKVAGLSNVKVTVSQNGTSITKTTNETGIVTFDKLKQGYVSIYVKGPDGFLSSNTVDELQCFTCDFDENDSEQIEYDQNTITLPRLGATVKGRVFADLDFNGTTAASETLPTSAVIVATIDNSYEPNVFKTNPSSDGTFQFTTLPEGVNVNFAIDFKKVDTTPTPTVEHSFYFDGGLSTTPDINNPKILGNIYAEY
jgi:hypothetical protein